MKVAVTVWDGRISPVFDVCGRALLLDISKGRLVSTSKEILDGENSTRKVDRLVALGVETLVCGAISEPLQRELQARGINVVGFVAGEVDEVVRVLVSGALPDSSLSMPGCRGRQARYRGGRGGGCGRGSGCEGQGK